MFTKLSGKIQTFFFCFFKKSPYSLADLHRGPKTKCVRFKSTLFHDDSTKQPDELRNLWPSNNRVKTKLRIAISNTKM